ncbi:hypothetical protein ACFSTC_16985 [Nonomuraea ferruginea]
MTNRDGVQTARTGLSKFGKTMVNFYLARLGVAQSEIGFPFLFHEVPYVRAQVALAEAGGVRRAAAVRVVPGRGGGRGEGGAARSQALQPVDLHQRLHDPEQVPRPARPGRDHPGDDRRGAHRQDGGRADRGG